MESINIFRFINQIKALLARLLACLAKMGTQLASQAIIVVIVMLRGLFAITAPLYNGGKA